MLMRKCSKNAYYLLSVEFQDAHIFYFWYIFKFGSKFEWRWCTNKHCITIQTTHVLTEEIYLRIRRYACMQRCGMLVVGLFFASQRKTTLISFAFTRSIESIKQQYVFKCVTNFLLGMSQSTICYFAGNVNINI